MALSTRRHRPERARRRPRRRTGAGPADAGAGRRERAARTDQDAAGGAKAGRRRSRDGAGRRRSRRRRAGRRCRPAGRCARAAPARRASRGRRARRRPGSGSWPREPDRRRPSCRGLRHSRRPAPAPRAAAAQIRERLRMAGLLDASTMDRTESTAGIHGTPSRLGMVLGRRRSEPRFCCVRVFFTALRRPLRRTVILVSVG